MSRALAVLAALAIATPAAGATYSGKPVTAASASKFVSRDIIWNQVGASYQGSTNESRPLVLCQSLAKRAGRLESFTVNGNAFAEADLAKCNAVAPQASGAPVAEAN